MSLDHALLVGVALVLMLAVGQLLVARRQSANRLLCSLFVVTAAWLAHAAGYRFGMLDAWPHLNKVYLPLFCLTGSLWYAYVRSLFDVATDDRLDRRVLYPALICTLLGLPFFAQDSSYKAAYVETQLDDLPSVLMYIASRLAECVVIVFFVRTLGFLGTVREGGAGQRITRSLRGLTAGALLAAIVRLLGSIAGSEMVGVVYACIIAIVTVLGMHLVSYRLPAVLGLGGTARPIRTVSDTGTSLERWRAAILAGRWYLDPDLKLQALARKLGVPPHTLSGEINRGTGANFKEFLAGFRVEHAKRLLLDEPKRAILDIAHASGFNSKSVFYRQFTERTGTTPARFRQGEGAGALAPALDAGGEGMARPGATPTSSRFGARSEASEETI